MCNIVLDNIIFYLQKSGGISVVWQNLIKSLNTDSDNIKFLEYDNNADNIFRKGLNIPEKNLWRRRFFHPIYSQFVYPKMNLKEKFIFHSSYFRTCNNPNAINVTTVHDFIYEQGNPTWKQKLRIRLNYKAIRNSDAIVCISENTRKDLFRYLPDIDSTKVYVIYNGVSEDYYPMNEIPYSNYKTHILFVGSRQGYKNFDFLVRALEKTDYRLLICGAPLTDQERTLLNQYILGRYDTIEYPTNEELNKIYNSVWCLVYPSSYEGFGLPVLEAQKAGCPVIALAASSIPEIVGNYSSLMPSLETSRLIEQLAQLEDSEIRFKLINSGLEAANRFSWEKMADEYLNLYNILLNK